MQWILYLGHVSCNFQLKSLIAHHCFPLLWPSLSAHQHQIAFFFFNHLPYLSDDSHISTPNFQTILLFVFQLSHLHHFDIYNFSIMYLNCDYIKFFYYIKYHHINKHIHKQFQPSWPKSKFFFFFFFQIILLKLNPFLETYILKYYIYKIRININFKLGYYRINSNLFHNE